MKISKVNHARAAVSAVFADYVKVEGVLYKDPRKKSEQSLIDIKGQYSRQAAQAKSLYSILNPEKQKVEGKNTESENQVTETSKVEQLQKKEIRAGIDKLISCLLTHVEEPKTVKDIDRIIEKQFSIFSDNKFKQYAKKLQGLNKDVAEELLGKHIRRSLKKIIYLDGNEVYIPDVITALFVGWIGNWERPESIPEKVGIQKVKAFLKAMDIDYFKPERKEKLVKSISNQKAHVSIIKKDEKHYLVPSYYNHVKKMKDGTLKKGYNKKVIFEFMCAYAAAEPEGQRDLLMHIRSLIVLYLCGERTYSDVLDKEYKVTEKTFGSVFSGEVYFSDDIKEKIEEKNKLKNSTEKLSEEDKRKKNIQLKAIESGITLDIERNVRNRFLEAKKVVGDSDSDLFWISYIDDTVRKMLLSNKKYKLYRFALQWIADHVWGTWNSYMATKFIEYGKAVYHFALPEIGNIKTQNVSFGEVQPEYRQGISSFEYERKKAREDLNKSIAGSVSFAANAFSRSVIKAQAENIDIFDKTLPYPVMESKDKKNKKVKTKKKGKQSERERGPVSKIYDNAGIRVLRYFGGVSKWQESRVIQEKNLTNECGKFYIEPLRKQLVAVRNESFHYSTIQHEETDGIGIVEKMYDYERLTFSDLIRDKYYSNNVHLFYGSKELQKLLNRLYSKNTIVLEQVPSFSKLFNRDSVFSDERILTSEARTIIGALEPENVTLFKGALFFLLKEVYYRGFLQDSEAKDRFNKVRLKPNMTIKNDYALNHFNQRIALIRQDATLGEICQEIMTDFELFNQNKRVNNDSETYKHFRDLLYIFIRAAFIDYLCDNEKNEVFDFIREPKLRESTNPLPQYAFCYGWTSNIYQKLNDNNKWVLRWYVLGHFLTPKHLNHLVGSFKSYMVYLENIDRRANDLNNRMDIEYVQEERKRIETILEMLGFVRNFCGRTSNNIGDYFQSDQAHRDLIWKLTDLPDEQLKGLYYDEKNFISNRNIILASMYGNLQIVADTCSKVDNQDVENYFKLKQELEEVFKKGFCQNIGEQKKLRAYQNLKNKIEFRDALTFTEIIGDLQGQLVSWSYYRERDLMYFQLGFYYAKLFFTDSIDKNDQRRRIIDKDISISDGAILYQIVAMYTYSLPLCQPNSANLANQISGKISDFIAIYGVEGYIDGLFLFENIDEHEDIIDTRNYIDHFKYYAEQKRSLLDLYSEIYDRFFSYSENFMKSVSYILPNILERYFVEAKLSFRKGEKTVKTRKEKKSVNATSIVIYDKLSSRDLTYKFSSEQGVLLIPARSDDFLNNVKKILEYKVNK